MPMGIDKRLTVGYTIKSGQDALNIGAPAGMFDLPSGPSFSLAVLPPSRKA